MRGNSIVGCEADYSSVSHLYPRYMCPQQPRSTGYSDFRSSIVLNPNTYPLYYFNGCFYVGEDGNEVSLREYFVVG